MPHRSLVYASFLSLSLSCIHRPALENSGDGAQNAACQISAPGPEIRFNEYFQIACHNCYEPQYQNNFKDNLNATKALEIDFYDVSNQLNIFARGTPGVWLVRHNAMGGNFNNCNEPGQVAGDFESCLTIIRDYSDQHPDHPVITVYLDKKQGWDAEGRGPEDLDKLLSRMFGNKIFTPKDLKGQAPTLREAVTQRGWPLRQDLQGKIILVLNGGQLLAHNKTLFQYVSARQDRAQAFVGVATDEASDFLGTPDDFDEKSAQWLVFYNLNEKNYRLSPRIFHRGYMSRVWGGDGRTPDVYAKACVQAVAYYQFQDQLKTWAFGADGLHIQ